MRQKSYDETPTLYIVPTPIGNMEDMTIRSINILKESEIIFSEDTRETGLLLKFFNITGPRLVSSHKFNENNNLDKIDKYLEEGKKISLVSDRGTPGISDPGYSIIREVINKGYNVVCLPGATAFVPAMVMSGLSTDRFLFYGFLNSKNSKQKSELENLKDFKYPIIFYEAPHRISNTLENMKNIFGNRNAVIAREISKRFEEIIRGNMEELINISQEIKGEMVIIVEGNTSKSDYSDISIEKHVEMYIEDGYESKDAIKLVAKARNLPKSEVYGKYHKK